VSRAPIVPAHYKNTSGIIGAALNAADIGARVDEIAASQPLGDQDGFAADAGAALADAVKVGD
jgi:hypothetical protein